VSVPALITAPLVFVVLLFSKMLSKVIPLFPTVQAFNYQEEEGVYFTLMMSTGLTFGTISALFGLNHGVITQAQYSHLVATMIGSAVIPTVIANALFMPKHLLSVKGEEKATLPQATVEELKPEYMRGYGEVPKQLLSSWRVLQGNLQGLVRRSTRQVLVQLAYGALRYDRSERTLAQI
jgi:glutathione-regulated potassium-efflux system ancillary protein KefC